MCIGPNDPQVGTRPLSLSRRSGTSDLEVLLQDALHLTEQRRWGGAVTRGYLAMITDGAEPATKPYALGGRSV